MKYELKYKYSKSFNDKLGTYRYFFRTESIDKYTLMYWFSVYVTDCAAVWSDINEVSRDNTENISTGYLYDYRIAYEKSESIPDLQRLYDLSLEHYKLDIPNMNVTLELNNVYDRLHNLNSFSKVTDVKTRFDYANESILELVEGYKKQGIVNEIFIEKCVPNKLHYYILFAPNATEDVEHECHLKFMEILKRLHIVLDEIVDDYNMGICWAHSMEDVDWQFKHACSEFPIW